MRALFLVFMVMASALSIKAAAVQWGRIYLNENGNLECAFPISSFSIYCEFASASDGSSAWSFTPYGADLEFVGTVYEAKAGAHINDRTVQRADSVFACRAEDGSIPKSWTPLNGNGPETRYLAFYFSSDYGEIFGWLELEVTGSAIFPVRLLLPRVASNRQSWARSPNPPAEFSYFLVRRFSFSVEGDSLWKIRHRYVVSNRR